LILVKSIETCAWYYRLNQYNVKSSDIKKCLSENNDFHPRDILQAISLAKTEIAPSLYKMISQNENISEYLSSMGFSRLEKDVALNLNKSVSHNERVKQEKVVKNWLAQNDSDDSDYSEPLDPVLMPPKSPKGKIVHFIPSHQMKIIKGIKR
jgi:hypothetical protein